MRILFIGTKNFGNNLNWLARRSKNKRAQLCQRPSQKFLDIENDDLTNIGKIPLELIEVQTGSYLEEDDIIRFEDSYGREVQKDTS